VISDSYIRVKEERDDNREIGVCPEHAEQYQRYEKGADIWWSHQLESGKWCKKPSQTGA